MKTERDKVEPSQKPNSRKNSSDKKRKSRKRLELKHPGQKVEICLNLQKKTGLW